MSRRLQLLAFAIVCLLVGVYALDADPMVRYGAWLVAFTAYMVWFVRRVVGLLRQPDIE